MNSFRPMDSTFLAYIVTTDNQRVILATGVALLFGVLVRLHPFKVNFVFSGLIDIFGAWSN